MSRGTARHGGRPKPYEPKDIVSRQSIPCVIESDLECLVPATILLFPLCLPMHVEGILERQLRCASSIL